MVDLQGLISELALHAKTCGTETRYNAFVRRYGPALSAQEAELTAVFVRLDHARARAGQDAFITSLANAQSAAAQAMGSDYCPRDLPLFTEVMSLDSGSELPQYAAGKNLVPATAQPECGAPAARPRARRARR